MQRRQFVVLAGAGGVGLGSACRKESRADSSGGGGEEVGPVEDLMREHGVIRRLLVVYRECARRLQSQARTVPLEPLREAAMLMRRFGEDYHEKQLEEALLFPDLRRARRSQATQAAAMDTLVSQHQRGRDLTEYLLSETRKPTDVIDRAVLATVLDGFARMYEEHAAFEDTIVFPAWKETMSPKALEEAGDRFERLEREALGPNGFENAVSKVGGIEQAFGVDLVALTAAPAP